ncbi:MAG TPA: lamin tail domain-containing protein [Flavilitoribacter sp.]|nr:lamin tail domain-containing protein [Flavilitoribacter sp.]
MNRFLPILLLFTLGSAALLKAQPFSCSDLFFSEYVEGSGSEKYIEIYNPTADPIDLSDYVLRLYSNGASTPSQSVNLGVAGTLASGEVVVFRNNSATLYTGGFVNSAVINHNGNDAFELYKLSTEASVDIFGRIGDNPGSAWTGAGGYNTADKTLRRKESVGKGVTVNPSGTGVAAFTTLTTEWDLFNQNDVSGLGSHTSDCISEPPTPTGCNELFISQYVEGTSFEKYIEIYNPTSSPIDLSNYTLDLHTNGAAAASTSSSLSAAGMLPSGGAVVFKNSQAVGYSGGYVISAVNHNGDDAYALVRVSDNTIVDIFGVLGDDPGSAWSDGGLSTMDRTLRRKSSVTGGVTINPSGTGPTGFATLTSEWDGYPTNDVSGLGAHTSDCIEVSCEIVSITLSNVSECDGQGSIGTGDDSFTADVTVTFANAPEGGSLELTGDGSGSVLVSNIDSPTSYTFTGVTMAADGTPIQLTASFSDEGACTLSELDLGTAPSPCSVIPDCGALFFSEYIEGSGNNKCVEIYNPTGSDIDLASGEYQIKMYFNGSASAGLTINLTGVIPSGGTYVVCNTGSTADFTSHADQLAGGGWFNGNDAIELSNAEGVLDVIGQIGNSDNFGPDVTLRRNYSVQKGDNDGSDAFTPAAEWTSFAINTAWGLGYHATDCQPALPAGWNPYAVGCDGTTTFDDGEWTQTTNCVSPGALADNVTFSFQEFCGNTAISATVEVVNYNASAGLMIRENLSPGSKMAWMFRRQGNLVYWKVRSAQNGLTSILTRPWLPSYKYIKIERSGNFFYGYVSTNGVSWIKLFQSVILMNSCGYVGLATESNVSTNTVTAHFNEVNLSGQINQSRGGNDEEAAFFDIAPQNLNLYPNPAQHELFVSVPERILGKAQVSIVDLNGKTLYNTITEVEGDRTIQLDLQGLNLVPGLYLVRVENGSDQYIQRFVKQ